MHRNQTDNPDYEVRSEPWPSRLVTPLIPRLALLSLSEYTTVIWSVQYPVERRKVFGTEFWTFASGSMKLLNEFSSSLLDLFIVSQTLCHLLISFWRILSSSLLIFSE